MSADPRGITITTPLGPDTLYLNSFRGREGLSQLFHFQLDLMAENRTAVAFDKLLGQKITFSILLPDSKTKRFWSGICNSLAQTGRDSTFTTFRMEVVPQLWLLTRRTQCRIFQHVSIPDILKKVLTGIDVKLELQGTFDPRDYCVQYRESDFDFASRLMEEEGIFYYFKHTDGGHQMVIGNSPQTHAPVIFAEKAIYEELQGGNRPDMRVHSWEKVQELRSGKVTLWDHCFELPNQHLDATRPTAESIAVGKVTHKLKLSANDPLELFDYPGAFAQRYDGIDAGGGEKAGDLSKIFQDNKRTAAIRMEEEAAQAITIRGAGNCRQFSAGHKFTLERHFDGDGAYVLTSVEHSATAASGSRSGGDDSLAYSNHFTCLPLALPFRPPCLTKEPFISGPQTAVVVGPPGEIIFCDKYGRIKVQFHWDREGKKNADSSCWIRVSNNWGGAGWGGMFLPHVGQEVIVEFEEGDPDRPLVTGRVYNAECMPPLKLPDHKTKSAIRDHGGNEMVMEGNGGQQRITMFSPTGSTKFSMGAPNSPTPGFYYKTELNWDEIVGGFEKVDITKESHRELHDNASEHIHGHWHQIIEKTSKVEVKDKQSEFVIGPVHKNITLWVSVFVGGFKTEVTVGAETKLIKGAKSEIIHGSQIKYHKGRLLDIKPAETENCKGNHLRKVGTAMIMSTKNMIAEARAGYRVKVAKVLEYAAEKVTQAAKGRSSITAASMLCSVKESLEHAADNYKVQASKIKADADTDWNAGTVKIKK